MDATEFTKHAGISRTAVNRLLHDAKIPEAEKQGKRWHIPDNWFERFELRRYSSQPGARLDVHVKQTNRTSKKPERNKNVNAPGIPDDIAELSSKERLHKLGSLVYQNVFETKEHPRDHHEALKTAIRFENLVNPTNAQKVSLEQTEKNAQIDMLNKLREKLSSGKTNSRWREKLKNSASDPDRVNQN